MKPTWKNILNATWNDPFTLQLTLWIAVAVIVLIVIVALYYKSVVRTYSNDLARKVNGLLKQCTQWYAVSLQDQHPILALIHINYSLSCAKAIEHLLPTDEIRQITGVNIIELRLRLEEEQSNAIQVLTKKCPPLQFDGLYASYTGWVL